MTKEEAIDIIKSECYVFNPLNFDRSTMVNTALDMAIKALEQESILDKIRAEIGEVYEELDGYDPQSLGTFVSRIDEIIDKYKTESEVEE